MEYRILHEMDNNYYVQRRIQIEDTLYLDGFFNVLFGRSKQVKSLIWKTLDSFGVANLGAGCYRIFPYNTLEEASAAIRRFRNLVPIYDEKGNPQGEDDGIFDRNYEKGE